MDVKPYFASAEPYIIERRRWYHQHPTLSLEEKETRDAIHQDLLALGITDIRDFESCYGLVATIRGDKAYPIKRMDLGHVRCIDADSDDGSGNG